MDLRPATQQDVPELAVLLVDAVDAGASVAFRARLTTDDAEAFWLQALPGVDTWVARLEAHGPVVGVVQLHPAKLPNGAHRADVATLLVHRRVRCRGVATALMARLEIEALARGRCLLLLDTQTGSAAQALCEKSGRQVVGVVENHAVTPEGRLAPTTFLSTRLR